MYKAEVLKSKGLFYTPFFSASGKKFLLQNNVKPDGTNTKILGQ